MQKQSRWNVFGEQPKDEREGRFLLTAPCEEAAAAIASAIYERGLADLVTAAKFSMNDSYVVCAYSPRSMASVIREWVEANSWDLIEEAVEILGWRPPRPHKPTQEGDEDPVPSKAKDPFVNNSIKIVYKRRLRR